MLTIRRPTSSTVLYTVSTRSADPSLAARLATSSLLILRLIAFITTLTVFLHEFNLLSTTHIAAPLLAKIYSHSTPLYRLIISSGILYLVFRKTYTEESLLVIRGLGVQTSTSSSSYLWASSTRFIPTSVIQDVFIHEAFKGFEVRFYLGIVVEGEEGVVVVFPNLLPRREVLEEVWRGARACLYEPKA